MLEDNGGKTGYTIPEVAEILNCSSKTVRRYINNGKLISTRLEGKYGDYHLIPEIPSSLVLPKEKTGICEACREERPLVRHHWFDTEGHYYSKEVCRRCNALLIPQNFPGEKEGRKDILPSWEKQLKYIHGLKPVPVLDIMAMLESIIAKLDILIEKQTLH